MDPHLQYLYEQGTELFNSGRYSEAEPLLAELIKSNPNYADVLNKLGVIFSLKGDHRNAAEYFEMALKINPRYTEASLNLAVTYNEMGEFKKAQDVFSSAAEFALTTPTALDPYASGKIANEHYKIGNMYLELCMYDDAIDEYQKAIKVHSGLPDVHTKLGIALRSKGLYDDALAHFVRAKEINPNYGLAWVQLGITYYLKGDMALALEELEAALRQNPDLKEAKTYLNLLKKEER